MPGIIIVDTTLRDGEQAPGFAFAPALKIRLASMMDEAGVDQIEAGVPAMGENEKATIRSIREACANARVSTWNRLRESDVRHSFDCSPHIIHLCCPVSDRQIKDKLKTTRAEVLEIKSRMFVSAARVMGASPARIIFRHILPVVLPTLMTIATLDFAFVMLAESALSFLGIGIQPPEITWGLMISQGRQYLTNAWWLSFWPGLAIILTTLSLNLLSNWLRIALDPVQRWRLEMKGRKHG